MFCNIKPRNNLICETRGRIHGEVVMSTQPRWLSHGGALDSNSSLVSSSVFVSLHFFFNAFKWVDSFWSHLVAEKSNQIRK